MHMYLSVLFSKGVHYNCLFFKNKKNCLRKHGLYLGIPLFTLETTNFIPKLFQQIVLIYSGWFYFFSRYYEATISEIENDGQVTVTFEQYGNTGVTTMGLLKISSLGFTASASSANKKEQLAKQREYLKKKKAKKAERYKNMEKEREQEKNKWQNFSNKAFGKKGFVKKSIFKTPENATGRVGIGTCGVGGAEMTKFTGSTKHYKK